jgi:hypothetical protein
LTDVLNPRRAPRVPLRCTVEIRHRALAWNAEIEDLGPKGCQILTPRIISRGREVTLTLRPEELGGRAIVLTGKVVWARPDSPSRIGVGFDPGTDVSWFDQLRDANPIVERAALGIPERIAADARLHLGMPPRRATTFTPDEIALLRAAAAGATVEQLARAMGDAFPRARSRLFSLIGRRMITLDAALATSPDRWRTLLGEVVGARRGTPLGTPAASPPAPSEARAVTLVEMGEKGARDAG